SRPVRGAVPAAPLPVARRRAGADGRSAARSRTVARQGRGPQGSGREDQGRHCPAAARIAAHARRRDRRPPHPGARRRTLDRRDAPHLQARTSGRPPRRRLRHPQGVPPRLRHPRAADAAAGAAPWRALAASPDGGLLVPVARPRAARSRGRGRRVMRPAGRWKTWRLRAFIALVSAGAVCVAYGYLVEPYWPEITRVRIASSRLPARARPVRVVLLS